MYCTFERAGNVCLSDIVISHRERPAGDGRLGDLSPREDTEEMRDDGDWTTTGEIGSRKYPTQLLVLLGIEILPRRNSVSIL